MQIFYMLLLLIHSIFYGILAIKSSDNDYSRMYNQIMIEMFIAICIIGALGK